MPLDPFFTSKVKIKEARQPNHWWKGCNNGWSALKRQSKKKGGGRSKSSHALRL
jgi:hypothetical protein